MLKFKAHRFRCDSRNLYVKNKSNYDVRISFEAKDYKARVPKETTDDTTVAIGGGAKLPSALTVKVHQRRSYMETGTNIPSFMFVGKQSKAKADIPEELPLYTICTEDGKPLGYRDKIQIPWRRKIKIGEDFDYFMSRQPSTIPTSMPSALPQSSSSLSPAATPSQPPAAPQPAVIPMSTTTPPKALDEEKKNILEILSYVGYGVVCAGVVVAVVGTAFLSLPILACGAALFAVGMLATMAPDMVSLAGQVADTIRPKVKSWRSWLMRSI